MIRRLVLALGVLLGLAGGARANCVLPFTLLNGTLADATQVMGNFNALNTCVNSLVTSQIAHTVLIGPTSGVPAAPTFRLLAGTDLPLPTSTTLGGVESIAVSSHKWINTISTAGAPSLTQPGVEDLSDPPMVMASFYGVTAGNSAATNTTDLIAAATAAYNLGLPLNICISGAASVVIPTNGSAFYGGMRIIPCSATTYQMAQAGAAFYTMPNPSSVTPGVSYTAPLAIDSGLNVDMNNQDGTALLIEGFLNCRVTHLITHNIATGSWSHNDGTGAANYLDAGLTLKTIKSTPGTGEYYCQIEQPWLTQPTYSPVTGVTTVTGGVGILLTATAGQSSPKVNVARVDGGLVTGFAKGVFLQAASDFHLIDTDLSSNTYAAVVGDPVNYSGVTINRAVFDHPYLESTANAPEYIGVWFTSQSQFGRLNGAASASAQAPCVDDNAPNNLCDSTKPAGYRFPVTEVTTAGAGTYNAPEQSAGVFDVVLVGGGAPGGGCLASSAGDNCVGGGGAAGAVVKAQCFDPKQMNMRNPTYTVGDKGTAGTGSGGNGADTVFNGAIQPFSAGTWTLPDWVTLTAYTARTTTTDTDFILPTVGNAGNYEFAAIAGGTTGAGPVTWPQTPGATVTDGTVTWKNMGKAVWTAGMTVVVDTSKAYPLGTLLGPATSQNAGSYFYMAVQPGTAGGGSHPTWPQSLLAVVSDNTAIWQNVARSISLSASGGTGGTSPGSVATSIEVAPRGLAGTNLIAGCTGTISDGVPGGNASFNVTNGFGHSATGGSNEYGRGGISLVVQNASVQSTGNDGAGAGAGGGGAISAINNSGTDKNGGAGVAGQLIIKAYAGASP